MRGASPWRRPARERQVPAGQPSAQYARNLYLALQHCALLSTGNETFTNTDNRVQQPAAVDELEKNCPSIDDPGQTDRAASLANIILTRTFILDL